MEEKIIKRDILDDLRSHADKKEISLIVGPRQAGKTTIMRILQKELKSKSIQTLFMSLDFEKDQPYFQSQSDFMDKLNLEFQGDRGVVFVDEIQLKKDAGLFLKGVYDMGTKHKIIVSGSGSIELKEKVHESLMGRKRLFELPTVSFSEFVNFSTEYRYDNRLDEFFSLEKGKTDALLKKYLVFGGYPKVVLESRLEEKQNAIDEIYRSYIEKDISSFLRVEKLDAFRSLVKILASQIGNLINYSELSNTLNLSVETVKNYLWYLEKTYIISILTPYYTNVRKEITKSPIYYFNDIGLRNYILGLFGVSLEENKGFVFENLVFLCLKNKFKSSNAEIHFWRTTNNAEVDFVVSSGNKIIPIEVKYKEFKNPLIERSLRSFIEKYNPDGAFVVNKNFKDTVVIGKTKVNFVTLADLISAI
ncbi:MAG: ATP-binding protein [bacterium]|nr:ATP-binding protein [bacterium]